MRETLPSTLQQLPFSYQEALDAGLTRHHLNLLVKNERLIRINKGLYLESTHYDQETKYQLATKQAGESSIICLLSAIEHYNLTDDIVSNVWLMVPKSKRIVNSKIKLLRKENLYLGIGVVKADGYLITSIERTLIECLIYQRLVGTSIALQALKRAISENLIKVSDLRKMAFSLKKEHLVKPYLEMLI